MSDEKKTTADKSVRSLNPNYLKSKLFTVALVGYAVLTFVMLYFTLDKADNYGVNFITAMLITMVIDAVYIVTMVFVIRMDLKRKDSNYKLALTDKELKELNNTSGISNE